MDVVSCNSLSFSCPCSNDDATHTLYQSAIPAADVPTASATAYVPDDNTPAARPGMSMVTKTVTYPDGRKVSKKLIAILK